MIYEYRADDGDTIEEVMAMTDPHPEIMVRGGKTYRRVFSTGHGFVYQDEVRPRHNLPKWWKGAKRFTSRGVPVMSLKEGRNAGLVPNPHLDDSDD